jgi:iron complex outermembrane recepter protein
MPASVWIAALAGAALLKEPELRREHHEREIIVTGERVPRSVRETPSSVAAATSREIDALSGADRIEQILDLIPNIQLGGGGEGPTIRGQDTTGPSRDLYAFLGGTRPRTTLIVDGRPAGFNEFVFGIAPLWDVERIEVFRSPQTTTQGKNSISGAIFVQTEDPSMDPQIRARAIYGQAHTRQLSAALSNAIVPDQVAVRVSGDYRYSHPSSDIRDRVPGADADHDEYGLLRVKLLATPEALPGARLELTYSHTQSEMPAGEPVRGPDFRKRQDLSGFAGIFRTNVDAMTAALSYDFGAALTANAVATHGHGKVRRFALPGFGQTRIEVKDWFAETFVRWSPDGPLSFVSGISHSRQHLRQHIMPLFAFGEGQFDDRQDGTGLFGEASLALSRKATLTGGLRYQRDSQKRVGTLGSGASATNLDFDESFHAWLPKISFAYDFTPTFRAGVLVQRAYNPGGVTLRGDIGAADPYKAETLWDYELFARGIFAGGAIKAAANVFYYDMRDAQRAQPYSVLGVGFADMFNVPKARSYGMEAQLEWRPSARFTAIVGIGLLRTKLVRTDAGYEQFDDKEFQRAPHFSASASLDWRPIDRLRLSVQGRHNSGYWSDEKNDPLRRIDNSSKVDVRAEWDAGRVRLFGYARNISDEFYLTSKFGPMLAFAGDPRELGIGIESDF